MPTDVGFVSLPALLKPRMIEKALEIAHLLAQIALQLVLRAHRRLSLLKSILLRLVSLTLLSQITAKLYAVIRDQRSRCCVLLILQYRPLRELLLPIVNLILDVHPSVRVLHIGERARRDHCQFVVLDEIIVELVVLDALAHFQAQLLVLFSVEFLQIQVAILSLALCTALEVVERHHVETGVTAAARHQLRLRHVRDFGHGLANWLCVTPLIVDHLLPISIDVPVAEYLPHDVVRI